MYRDLPALETDRLVLRRLREADADDVFECCSDPLVARFMRWEPHATRERRRAVVGETLEQYRRGSGGPWGTEHKPDGKLIGTVFLGWPPDGHGCADLGYAMHRGYRNRGPMTQVLRGIVRSAFAATDLNRVQALCEPEIAGSWRALEQAGLTLEGTRREWQFSKGRHRDLRLYAVLRRDWNGETSHRRRDERQRHGYGSGCPRRSWGVPLVPGPSTEGRQPPGGDVH